MTQFKHDKSCPVYGDFPADDVPCQCKGEQDSLTVGQIRVLKFWLAEYAYIGKDETEFTDKTEFYTPEEVKDCLLSHIDTLTKQVESQKEEIRKYCEDGIFMTHEMIEDTAKQVARDCAEIARDQCFGVNAYKAIRTKYSLPKEE